MGRILFFAVATVAGIGSVIFEFLKVTPVAPLAVLFWMILTAINATAFYRAMEADNFNEEKSDGS